MARKRVLIIGAGLAGQWIVPGGGVPPCLVSGRHVAEMLCRRDGKPFKATVV